MTQTRKFSSRTALNPQLWPWGEQLQQREADQFVPFLKVSRLVTADRQTKLTFVTKNVTNFIMAKQDQDCTQSFSFAQLQSSNLKLRKKKTLCAILVSQYSSSRTGDWAPFVVWNNQSLQRHNNIDLLKAGAWWPDGLLPHSWIECSYMKMIKWSSLNSPFHISFLSELRLSHDFLQRTLIVITMINKRHYGWHKDVLFFSNVSTINAFVSEIRLSLLWWEQ